MKKLIAILALALPLTAFASGAPQSLNITNYITSALSLTSYPTNTYNTNGLPQSTGNAVPVFNQEHIGFNFEGFFVGTNLANATIGFVLVTSMAGNTPTATSGTNNLSGGNTVLTGSDFATAGLGVIPINFTVANATNGAWVNWQTNFAAFSPVGSMIGDVNFIGVYQITNNMPGGCYITNAAAYINKKLIPTPLIGN
jgi:hypothetical protein